MGEDGCALGARFSLATNRLQYCGPADAEPALYEVATRGTGTERARAALARFEALYPYLEAIGAKHDLDPLDPRVVEAYWIGNELLEPFGPADFRGILERLRRRGLPRSTAARLSGRLPERPIPHHTFHVTFVGVGEVTGHVETTLANMDRCRPSEARVLRVDAETLSVAVRGLELRGGRLELGPERPVEVRYDPALTPNVRAGDRIAVHWGLPALLLSPGRAEALARWTQRSLHATNSVTGGPFGPASPEGSGRIAAGPRH